MCIYLFLRERCLVYASGDAVPGPGTHHGGQQPIQLPCIQLLTVLLHRGEVPVD